MHAWCDGMSWTWTGRSDISRSATRVFFFRLITWGVAFNNHKTMLSPSGAYTADSATSPLTRIPSGVSKADFPVILSLTFTKPAEWGCKDVLFLTLANGRLDFGDQEWGARAGVWVGMGVMVGLAGRGRCVGGLGSGTTVRALVCMCDGTRGMDMLSLDSEDFEGCISMRCSMRKLNPTKRSPGNCPCSTTVKGCLMIEPNTFKGSVIWPRT